MLEIMLGVRGKTESDERFEELFRFLRANPGPTLIYVALQQQAETHAEVLKQQGFNAEAFHAGLKTERKQYVQDAFMASKIQIASYPFPIRPSHELDNFEAEQCQQN